MLRNTLGREPTRAEVNDRVEKLKEKNAEFPHTRVVVAAFEKGEEVRPISNHLSPGHSLTCTAESLCVGARMQGLRGGPPVGDCRHVPTFQKGRPK